MLGTMLSETAIAASKERAAFTYLLFSLRADRQLQRLKREYSDPSSRSNSSRLAEDLNDISNIMKRSITEVLDRGEKLEGAYCLGSRRALAMVPIPRASVRENGPYVCCARTAVTITSYAACNIRTLP